MYYVYAKLLNLMEIGMSTLVCGRVKELMDKWAIGYWSRGTHNSSLEEIMRQVCRSKSRCKIFPCMKIEIRRTTLFSIISFLKLKVM